MASGQHCREGSMPFSPTLHEAGAEELLAITILSFVEVFFFFFVVEIRDAKFCGS
jgi:hypothetical protein